MYRMKIFFNFTLVFTSTIILPFTSTQFSLLWYFGHFELKSHEVVSFQDPIHTYYFKNSMCVLWSEGGHGSVHQQFTVSMPIFCHIA